MVMDWGTYKILELVRQHLLPKEIFRIDDLLYNNVSLEGWSVVLKSCPHLKWASIDLSLLGRFRNEEARLEGLPMTHHNLTEMIMRLRHPTGYHIFLPFVNFQFPNLNRLQLPLDVGSVVEHFDGVYDQARFIETFPSLQTLFIDAKSRAVRQAGICGLFPLLRSVPSIITLTVALPCFEQLVSIYDFINNGGQSMLPDLQCLNVGVADPIISAGTDTIRTALAHSLLGDETYNAKDDYKTGETIIGASVGIRNRARLASVKHRIRLVSDSESDSDNASDDQHHFTSFSEDLKAKHMVDIDVQVFHLSFEEQRGLLQQRGASLSDIISNESSAHWYFALSPYACW
ncbi:hypothetical protein CVT24_011959 [Panaeolus cyanescens]|uniref:F-box domain-containing protein n=1 Tax=Panaeolus cyanescens TaxID=181874 RepID=A0A409VIF1_9AGAR|nr:hypothetical protein CVT24_011959 [Panaeolus cyanescens]